MKDESVPTEGGATQIYIPKNQFKLFNIMYTRLNHNRTKKYYREIVENAIDTTEVYIKKFPSIEIYNSILKQLKDIQRNIIFDNVEFNEETLYERYNLGAIAVKNFDLEKDEYAQRLSDVFGGSFDYYSMPENNS